MCLGCGCDVYVDGGCGVSEAENIMVPLFSINSIFFDSLLIMLIGHEDI